MDGSHDNELALVTVVCGVVLEHEGKFLLVQERRPKAYGKWNLPAGRVDKGETLEQAAVREAFEETGFKVELKRHLRVLHTSMERSVLHAYEAKITGGDLRIPHDELLDARWFSLAEIRSMKGELRDVDFVLGSVEVARS